MFNRIRTRFDRRRGQRGWAPWMSFGAVAVAGGGAGTVWSVADWRIEQTGDGLICGIEKDMLKVIGVKATPGARLASAATEQRACELLFDQKNVARCPVFAPSAYARCFNLWEAATKAVPPQPAASAPARILVTAVEGVPRAVDTGLPALVAGRIREWVQPAARVLLALADHCPSAQGTALRLTMSNGDLCLGVAIGSTRFATAAHCVSGLNTVSVSCPASAASGPAPANCTLARNPVPPDHWAADLAVCIAETAGPACLDPLVRSAQWDAPPAGQEPRPLHIVGVAAANLSICKTTNEISWPGANEEETVLARLPEGEGEFKIEPGDSGGPVSDGIGAGRPVIGVSVKVTRPGEQARIVPFYRWKEKFEPDPQ